MTDKNINEIEMTPHEETMYVEQKAGDFDALINNNRRKEIDDTEVKKWAKLFLKYSEKYFKANPTEDGDPDGWHFKTFKKIAGYDNFRIFFRLEKLVKISDMIFPKIKVWLIDNDYMESW